MSLLVVGSVALDSIETPLSTRERILGGSASYFATVAALFHPARVVAVVGEDFPEEHVAFLRSRQADLAGLQHAVGKTFHWSGRYLENFVDRVTLDTQLNVFESFQPSLPEAYRDSQFVFLANIMPALQLQVLRQIQAPLLVAADTMNFWITEAHKKDLDQVLARSQVVFINDEEARLLSGEANLIKAAKAVRRLGVEHVIVKRGDAGALLVDDAGLFWAPAYPLDSVVDPTGAGDSFAGGFMSYLAARAERSPAAIRSAMIAGAAAASFTVEDFSVDRFRTLSKAQLLSRCAELRALVSCEPVVD